MLSRVCAFAFGLAVTSGVAASPDVLLHEAPGVRPGLCDALRIQLSGVAVVTCRADDDTAGLALRIARVARDVRTQEAQLGAFLVVDDAASTVQLVVVGREEDAALISFEPIRDRPAPDVDRSLALKLSDTLDSLRRARVSPTALGPLGGALTRADAVALARPQRAPTWAALLEAGYALSVARQLRSAGAVNVGVRHRAGRAAVEVAIAGLLAGRVHTDSPTGGVDVRAWDSLMTARVLYPMRHCEVGAYGGAGLERVSADGRSLSGARGQRSLNLVPLSVGLDLRVSLYAGSYLRFAPGITWLPSAPDFAVDGVTTLRTGHLRAELPVLLGVQTR